MIINKKIKNVMHPTKKKLKCVLPAQLLQRFRDFFDMLAL